MPQQGISFAGTFIPPPGAYYQDDVSAATPNNPPTTPPMLVLGYGWGPKPKAPVTFTSPADFAAAVRGAPVAAFIPFIANPSPAQNGAQLITFIDVSRNTQSLAALVASGALGTQTLLTSTLYGPPSNQLSYQVANGSTAGLKLTITDNYGGGQYVGDNLTVPFQLAYSGQASGSVTYSVVVSGNAPAFSVSSPVSGESVTIPIGSGAYATVATLTEALNGTGNYYAVGLSSTGGQLPSNFLTATGSVSLAVPVSGVLQYANVRAYLQEIAYWVNQFASPLASATVSGTVDSAGWLPVTGVPAFFSGATGVPPVNSDYASGFTAGLTVPAWTVFADSNATAVQALMAQHCETASSPPYGMWRRGFTGSSIGDTVATTTTNATNLDSLQMVYVYPGIYQTNTNTGQNQLYGGLYAAASAAAIATGNIVALPLTNKVLNGNGVEAVNAGLQLTVSQLSTLQNAGVLALWQTAQFNGPPTFLSDVTTWQVDDNVENTSTQQVACRYWLAYSVVTTLRRYVGTIATPTTEASILNALKRLLNALIYTGGASNGVLASWDSNSLVLVYDGQNQLASITVNVTLVGQNRFITCFASVEPLAFTITAS
jgi:hypothetical protein